ncbi:MAG: sugar ABC transporter ATP-binding protein [Actinobacteria bacterium]|nr:sugar ABC transporter ATP-binding protein [Actinomycetota bacterium]NBY82509.1 sugar ABC transporter ATP-binding protein [Actinomycetota bacterium]NCA25659.1 sugar ABC transporter ATP-binding protein [Actinomycetota bacterium]NCU78087.1 sugar ABC transporter ATP-binding protein [Actinomycetota bacterium]
MVKKGDLLLEMNKVQKRFGGAVALRGTDLKIRAGEIHALLGENGAGKSTMLKILAGVHVNDGGTIKLGGKDFITGSPKASIEQGIAVIYQEPSLFLDLSLAENVFIGRQPKKGKIIDWKYAQSEASRLFKELGVELDPKRQARGLSIADQQVVEIAKALSMNANIILMDEPTAALSASEVDRLMTVMKSLKAANKAVIFVSHRLDEVFAISDYITVMRDGATVSEADVKDTNLQKVIKDMVGRELTEMFPKTENKIGSVVLEVNDLTNPAFFRNISFNVKKGEIVALAGLVGAGRSEVARAIFGVDRYESGSVKVNGQILPAGSPVEAMARKIALVPEDRRQQGLFMIAGVNRNISMESFAKLTDRGLLNLKRERELTNTWREKLSIKFNNQADPVDRLSGGNQQKTVLAKWLATEPDLLIVDEPTRGIDVATKAEVHRLVNQAASEGKAVLMISSELPEVLGMADRIIVMREGRQVAEFSRKEATQEKIIAAATTGKKSA